MPTVRKNRVWIAGLDGLLSQVVRPQGQREKKKYEHRNKLKQKENGKSEVYSPRAFCHKTERVPVLRSTRKEDHCITEHK